MEKSSLMPYDYQILNQGHSVGVTIDARRAKRPEKKTVWRWFLLTGLIIYILTSSGIILYLLHKRIPQSYSKPL
jgi:hypothetical protein